MLIDLIEISKAYEAQKILCKVSFNIKSGDKIALLGKNGGGKSTLMKIVNGTLEFDDGRRIIKNGITIDMLDQVPCFEDGLTVKDAIEKALVKINKYKQKYENLSIQIAKNPDDKNLSLEYSEVLNYLDHHNAWNIDDKIQRILEEFKLKQYEDREVTSLSVGEQRRVALSSLIVKKPDILLLDEPTNHLDVYMVEFLEDLLKKERFTLLFISHDRYFIDRLATKTIEIDDCKIRSFDGGYRDYIRQKEELLVSLQKSHETLIKHLKKEEEWLSRGVRARIKRNEGRKERIFKLREDAKKNPSLIRQMKLQLEREQKNFNQTKSKNRKKMLFEIEDISLTLGKKKLISHFSNRILQHDTIAIVGQNGAGKSTLLKILLGELKPDSGKIKRGEFKIGYFDQQKAHLDDSKSLIETFCPNGGDRVDVRGKNMHVFGYLKSFLFPREHLDKKIGILSGGEKSRVALALLFTKQVDCLILDEPTNDLDIPTINILEEYLKDFDGSLIFVSHDRYFVDKIAKKLFIFKGDGEIEESWQNYSQFLEIEKEINELTDFEKNIQKEKPKPKQKKQKIQTKLSYKEQKLLQTLPQEIEELENEIEKLNNCLQDPKCYEQIGITQIASKLEELNAIYEKKVDQYLKIEEKAEFLRLT